MNPKRRKIISFAACAIFLFVAVAALFYVAKEENHHCTGKECDICACVHQAEQTLKNLGAGTAALVCLNPVVMLFVGMLAGFVLCVLYTSLVSRKVRMDN